MNTRLLRRIQKQILKEPRQFVMDAFFSRMRYDNKTIPNCGTAACIAGHAVSISHRLTPEQSIRRFAYPAAAARTALELDREQGNNLFYFEQWPRQFRKRSEDNPKQAVARIEHFIKTKGEE